MKLMVEDLPGDEIFMLCIPDGWDGFTSCWQMTIDKTSELGVEIMKAQPPGAKNWEV